MIEPRASVRRIATSHVRAEFARGAAFERVAVRFHQSLAKLVGQAGFDVLLARAVLLAARGQPILEGVHAGRDGTLVGLALAEHSRDPEAVEPAAVAIIANFIELLVVLIGEELTMRLLDEAPEDASHPASSPPEKEKR